MPMMRTLFERASIYCGGRFAEGDLLLEGDRIAAVGSALEAPGARRIDARGLCLLPGLVDVHVHLREPGAPQKETIATGTAAAARGGYTAVCAMPNLSPAPDTPEHLERELEIIRRDARVRVYPYATITRGRRGCGEPVDFEAMKEQVVGFSDDGCGVQDEALMREAMRRAAAADRPVAAHCEVDELLRGGYIHDGAWCRAHGHRGICSESEWRQVERDIRLAAETGCRYHVCHVSTRRSVELVRRAKAAGLSVSCETAPHYLLLCDEDLRDEGRFKMNPPLRSRDDRQALLEGIADGTIEVVATDHAPHTAAEKALGLAGSAMGIVGLETAFPLLYTRLVLPGVVPFEKLVALMADNPRRLFRVEGGIAPGASADLMLFDPAACYAVDPAEFLSKGRSTPFEGWKVRGRTLLTLVGGVAAYEDENLKRRIK